LGLSNKTIVIDENNDDDDEMLTSDGDAEIFVNHQSKPIDLAGENW
jgi:hypothetical protein